MIIRRGTGRSLDYDAKESNAMAPRSVARGTPRSGDRAAEGCQDRASVLSGRLHPAAGSHLPSEDTAPPCAVVPFASSPFAHPIPQSRRRASGDLFSASLEAWNGRIKRCRCGPTRRTPDSRDCTGLNPAFCAFFAAQNGAAFQQRRAEIDMIALVK